MRFVVQLFLMCSLLIFGINSVVAESHKFVRFEQSGEIYWGELEGNTIHQLDAAPYLNGKRTGVTVAQTAVALKAPVDPKLVVMTALN